MRDVTRNLYTIWAMLLLTVMLVGSPLSGFGCQTVAPDHLQMPCETGVGGTAVQSNFFQPATAISFIVMLAIVCWLTPKHHPPQEMQWAPPSPPPRSLQV